MSDEIKKCAHCGFTLGKRRSEFCSDYCYRAYKRKNGEFKLVCVNCGADFVHNTNKKKCCSQACATARSHR